MAIILHLSPGGGVLVLTLIILLIICCLVKGKRIRDFRSQPKVDINDTYGTYDMTGEMSDYTVEDTNDYYGR